MKKNLEEPCPIARALAILGDGWSLLVMRDAHAGLTRFTQFQRSLGIAPTILTKRLSVLTAEGLLRKESSSDHPTREEYLLTDAGRELLPVLFAIGGWSRRHRGGGEMVRFLDAETETEIRPLVIDENTGATIGSRAIKVVYPKVG